MDAKYKQKTYEKLPKMRIVVKQRFSFGSFYDRIRNMRKHINFGMLWRSHFAKEITPSEHHTFNKEEFYHG